MNEQRKQAYNNWFADGFDIYVADGRTLKDAPVEGNDMLSRFVRDVIDRNPNLGGSDPKYRDSFKDNLQQFVGDMLDKFSNFDRDTEPEKMMQNRFQQGTSGEQRAMWQQVKEFTKAKYSPTEVNTDGYDEQLKKENEQQIFEMFARDWRDASEAYNHRAKSRMLASATTEWEKNFAANCKRDYKTKKRLEKSLHYYPLIDDIAEIIGRARNIVTHEKSATAFRYRPSSISPTPSFEEIDRITTGNNLERVIPSEFSYLAESDTEMLFLSRYAGRQLQQFTSPGSNLAVRNPRSAQMPRPALGPIIVSVDTSGSMDGRASEIASAMVLQLLNIARNENRRCYLITFSVRSKAIDLSEPGQWRNVEAFLSDSYTGSTNGEQMLRDAINRLDTENYSMADVLIISDFAFAMPLPATLAAIRREQTQGTRFYGLQIGCLKTPYRQILDKIWTIN